MKEHVLLQRCFRGALLGLSMGLNASLSQNLIGTHLRAQVSAQSFATAADSSAVYTALSRDVLMASIPGLLRHHDSWQRRWDWICLHMTDAIVPILVLGDVLERVLCGCATLSLDGWLSEFTHLQSGPTRYDLSSSQQQYYQKTLADISSGLSSVRLSDISADLHDDLQPEPRAEFSQTRSLAQAAFVSSVVNALRHPESCDLPVRLSAQLPALAIGVAPAIAGLVSGAMGAQASLSVMWQVHLARAQAGEQILSLSGSRLESRAEVTAIADDLYHQWAGISASNRAIIHS